MVANWISSDRIVRLMASLLIGFVITPVALPQHGGGALHCHGCVGTAGPPDSTSTADTYVAIYVTIESGVCTDQTGLSCNEEDCSAVFVVDWQSNVGAYAGEGEGSYCDPNTDPPDCRTVPLPPTHWPPMPPPEPYTEGQETFDEDVGCGSTMERTWTVDGLTVSTWAKCSTCKKTQD